MAMRWPRMLRAIWLGFALGVIVSTAQAATLETTIRPNPAIPNAPILANVAPTVYYTPSPTVKALIGCESSGKNVVILDTNGLYSYGILQFQMPTWLAFSASYERATGLKVLPGGPTTTQAAIQVANWATTHGLLSHWSCAAILGLL